MTAEQLGQVIGRINDAKTWHELRDVRSDLHELLDEHYPDSEDHYAVVRLINGKLQTLQPKNGEKYIYRQGNWPDLMSPVGEVADGEIVQVEDRPGLMKAADNDTYCYIVSEDGSRYIGSALYSQLYPIPKKQKRGR